MSREGLLPYQGDEKNVGTVTDKGEGPPSGRGVKKAKRRSRSPDRPSTIRDVAAKAGVSLATVSRTLADNYPVPAETRERVQAAVDSLHYVVNVHAKALSGRVADPIALVMRDIIGPPLAHVAAGVEQEAGSRGHLSPDQDTQAPDV
jgi:LacI family transcriptional regulator